MNTLENAVHTGAVVHHNVGGPKSVRESLQSLFRKELSEAEWAEIIMASDKEGVAIKEIHAVLLADRHLPEGVSLSTFTNHLRKAKERLGGNVKSRTRKPPVGVVQGDNAGE